VPEGGLVPTSVPGALVLNAAVLVGTNPSWDSRWAATIGLPLITGSAVGCPAPLVVVADPLVVVADPLVEVVVL
jgi:hypothetical protein